MKLIYTLFSLYIFTRRYKKIYILEGKLILSTGAAFFNSYRILHTMKDRNTCKEDKMIKRSLYLHLQLIITRPK